MPAIAQHYEQISACSGHVVQMQSCNQVRSNSLIANWSEE